MSQSNTATHSKLYMVTRQDLSLGYQIVQTAHATAEFMLNHSQIARKWRDESQYMVALSVPDESELSVLMDKASKLNISFSAFREPDIGNEVTAVVFAPTEHTRKLLSQCSLAGKQTEKVSS